MFQLDEPPFRALVRSAWSWVLAVFILEGGSCISPPAAPQSPSECDTSVDSPSSQFLFELGRGAQNSLGTVTNSCDSTSLIS